jgi:hypothetical protein
MGNHEFCAQCEENDFHYGEPCDPKRVAAVQKKEQEEKARLGRQIQEATKLMAKLKVMGIKEVKLDKYAIEIPLWSLSD